MKMIINNESDLSMLYAIQLVNIIIKQDIISNDSKPHRYIAEFIVGDKEYVVAISLNKKSHSFKVINVNI